MKTRHARAIRRGIMDARKQWGTPVITLLDADAGTLYGRAYTRTRWRQPQ